MVSVCIPTFNGEKYIKEQLTSILNQITDYDEVIISDDSSADDTVRIVKELGDPRITILENNHFRSPIFNLENALNVAKGDYIFLSDQDDIWHPQKVSVCLDALQNYDIVITDCFIIDEERKTIHESFFKLNKSTNGVIKNLVRNGYLGCCMAFNRKILEYCLPFPKTIAMHDIWIGLNAELIGKCLFLKEKLVYYRRHSNNVSFTSGKSKFSVVKKITYRISFVKEIVKRRFLKLIQ